MAQAKTGDIVTVHYTGTLDDGTQFDSSQGGEPFVVTLGQGEAMPCFEKGLEGMSIGDKKSIRIEAVDAYGEFHEGLVNELNRSEIKLDQELQVGMEIQASTQDGNTFMLVIKALNGDKVTL
ncbi:MAG: FKBP-type peptidyl-prolyl cis-trans isomerase, partial [Candidatus Polarisedimenticolaceae bacterium]|nr:FKBP-type peptidyl-prolyl cis-trans isomerase [Candidatus Polarisedimenticolaceae bacterium]